MELFPFQEKTVKRFKDQRGVLIAHDMGLGKTVTAIALDAEKRLKFEHPARTLIICPLAVINSWIEHFKAWAPHLHVLAVDNKNRKPFMELVDYTFTNGVGYDVFIIHPAAVRLEPDLAKYPWFHVIVDECHCLQDRKASQTKAIKKIKAFYKTGLSGTPVFNKPDDLWSILNWLYPKYWSSYWAYFKRYIKWVEWDGYRQIIGVENEEELQNLIASFYSRIKKEEVAKDLPEKYYSNVKIKLHPQQARAYKQMKKDLLAWIGEHEHQPLPAPVIIAQLMRLQQFASAYAELENYEVEVKTKVDPDQVAYLRSQGVTVYGSSDGQHHNYYTKRIEPRVRVKLSEPSSKLDAVMEIIQGTDQQIVVFSQFSQMVELLAKRLEKANISHGLYTGSVPKEERDQIVDDFQSGKLRVFAGSIKAGGVGLTLTAASTVILLNREWAETLNEQAINRCHRIGSKNAVHVIDVIAEDTLDAQRNLGIANNWSVIKKLLGE